MPKGTRVSNCVQKIKKEGGGVNPYAVCQAATGQSYASGKPLKRLKVLAPKVKGLKAMYCLYCGRPFHLHPFLPCPYARMFMGRGMLRGGMPMGMMGPGFQEASDVGAGEPSVGGGDWSDAGDHADGGDWGGE